MNEVNKTLFIPLYGKAKVSKQRIILHDPAAERIWAAEGFPIRGKSKSKWLCYNMAMRARVFDDWAEAMLWQHPDASLGPLPPHTSEDPQQSQAVRCGKCREEAPQCKGRICCAAGSRSRHRHSGRAEHVPDQRSAPSFFERAASPISPASCAHGHLYRIWRESLQV